MESIFLPLKADADLLQTWILHPKLLFLRKKKLKKRSGKPAFMVCKMLSIDKVVSCSRVFSKSPLPVKMKLNYK